MYKIKENKDIKVLKSSNYNYYFDKNTGCFARWGKTTDEDPVFSPFGPEILDYEVTDICNGIGNKGPCSFCYKSNTGKNSNNVSFNDFKTIFHKLPPTITQIAFGVDSKGTSNPDMLKMMWYARENGVIPNVTVADIDDEMAKSLAEVCGAVSISRYEDKNYCYDSINLLYKHGLKQINIHILVSDSTIDQIYETFHDYLNGEERLKGLNSIVLLSLKQKGRGKHFKRLSQEKFKEMVNFALDNNIPIGFDSCGANKLLKSIEGETLKRIEPFVEPCESFGLFSAYINCKNEYFPCSFAEGEGNWKEGINMLEIDDFLKEVWYNEKLNDDRKKSLSKNRECLIYKI